MRRNVDRLGKWHKKSFTTLPQAKNIVAQPTWESIMLFGGNVQNDNEFGFQTCFGIGWVKEIKKGDECDIVYMNCGVNDRMIILTKTDARKQLFTLKTKQIAMFYGVYKTYTRRENGKKVYDKVINAYNIQGWYVPKSFDRKHSETLDELNNMSDIEISETNEIMKLFEK